MKEKASITRILEEAVRLRKVLTPALERAGYVEADKAYGTFSPGSFQKLLPKAEGDAILSRGNNFVGFLSHSDRLTEELGPNSSTSLPFTLQKAGFELHRTSLRKEFYFRFTTGAPVSEHTGQQWLFEEDPE